jgi:hypothetical protein
MIHNLVIMGTQIQSKERLQSTSVQPMPVTVDNFKRAESDMYFANIAKSEGRLCKLYHRELFSVDQQAAVRDDSAVS